MASGDGANKVHEDIARVQKCIEKCLMVYMNKKEAMDTLITQDHQDPDVAEIVWHRLETQNPEFFKAYHLMRLVRQQIVEFNRLLSEQAELMRRTGLSGMTSVPMSNESNVSTSKTVFYLNS
ncbi:hypothetical protein Fot_31581 [Forsythia ovata]|uniref:Uncharacterized protein n=1 Tax=Forsythia ovata TaxID=205694 RepID=A0ABD1T5C2_9LAMI